MNEKTLERLSVCIDGELESEHQIAEVLAMASADADGKKRWQCYCLIGELMRGGGYVVNLSPDTITRHRQDTSAVSWYQSFISRFSLPRSYHRLLWFSLPLSAALVMAVLLYFPVGERMGAGGSLIAEHEGRARTTQDNLPTVSPSQQVVFGNGIATGEFPAATARDDSTERLPPHLNRYLMYHNEYSGSFLRPRVASPHVRQFVIYQQ